MQAICKKYPYDHVHDDASLQDILKELAAADSVRNLREAPEPKCANAVNEQYSLLQQMIQQANDCEEEAMVVHLDSPSSPPSPGTGLASAVLNRVTAEHKAAPDVAGVQGTNARIASITVAIPASTMRASATSTKMERMEAWLCV